MCLLLDNETLLFILKDSFPCDPDFLNLTDVEACSHGDVANEENKHDAR